MNNKYLIGSIAAFVLYVLVQVLLVRELVLFNVFFPFLYIGFLLLLPLDIDRITLILLGFFCGFTVDFFYDSMGVNAAACTLIAFLRPHWLRVVVPAGGYEDFEVPSMNALGISWFMTYALPLVFTHHLVLFYLEAGGFHLFFNTLLKVMASTVYTFLLLLMVQMLFYKERN